MVGSMSMKSDIMYSDIGRTITPPKPKLSELEIDVDKDWLSHKIYNVVVETLENSILKGKSVDVEELKGKHAVLQEYTTTPSLVKGMLWFEAGDIYFTPDGTTKKSLTAVGGLKGVVSKKLDTDLTLAYGDWRDVLSIDVDFPSDGQAILLIAMASILAEGGETVLARILRGTEEVPGVRIGSVYTVTGNRDQIGVICIDQPTPGATYTYTFQIFPTGSYDVHCRPSSYPNEEGAILQALIF